MSSQYALYLVIDPHHVPRLLQAQGAGAGASADADDEDVPELVENFDEAAAQ